MSLSSDTPLAYVRNALLEGLALDAELGANPFAHGFVGSSDTHNGTPGATLEDYFPGHTGSDDSTPALRLSDSRVRFSPGGLMAVYAEENSRASLFDGIERRESYATSGTRPTLRLFAGFDLPVGLCAQPDLVEQGYAQGVPMGGELAADPTDVGPRFVVSALKDPGSPGFPGTPLAEIEIVKGWVDDAGATHESVVTIAGGPPGPGALDIQTCTTDGSGTAALCGEWQDLDFDPDEHAFYYARLHESPTCRWSALECRAQGVDCTTTPPTGFENCCDGSVPDAIQERATSSPIWVKPVPEPGIGVTIAASLIGLSAACRARSRRGCDARPRAGRHAGRHAGQGAAHRRGGDDSGSLGVGGARRDGRELDRIGPGGLPRR